MAGEALPDQHFVVTHTVKVTRVEQRDTRIERDMNRGDTLRAVGRTIEVRHSHASKADSGHVRTAGTEFSIDHCFISSFRAFVAQLYRTDAENPNRRFSF